MVGVTIPFIRLSSFFYFFCHTNCNIVQFSVHCSDRNLGFWQQMFMAFQKSLWPLAGFWSYFSRWCSPHLLLFFCKSVARPIRWVINAIVLTANLMLLCPEKRGEGRTRLHTVELCSIKYVFMSLGIHGSETMSGWHLPRQSCQSVDRQAWPSEHPPSKGTQHRGE